MATSMLAGVQELLTPSFLSRVSSQTGESEAAISKGFTAVVPTLLASIADRSGDSGFMNRLVNLASNTATENDNLTRKPISADTTLESGSGIGGWLSGLWSGGSLSAITSAIARYSGVRASSASSLLSLAGPLVLGYLGKLMRSDNLDASTLAQRLQSERGALTSALPAGFNAFLPSAATATGDDRREFHYDVIPRETPAEVLQHEGRRSGGWLWPLALLALAIAGLLWWNARTRTPDSSQAANTVSRAVDSAGTTVRTAARALPGGVKMMVPSGGMEDRLISYLAAPTGTGSFDFDRLEFETGSTSLTARSRAQITDVARILTAYPNANVQISGYTDNTGDEVTNQALSRGRAEAVMNALRESGAPAANLTAQGFGSRNPVADNATEAGRARNRRVTLSITGI
jgi:outer membrane protein OmpA-like peptidoglycan-associated protein